MEEGQGGTYHQQWPKDKWRSHPYDNHSYGSDGERNLGMENTFCHHDQAKVEASKALSTLCQHKLPEPSVVVVREVHQLTLSPLRAL